jgi:hypothetical protein
MNTKIDANQQQASTERQQIDRKQGEMCRNCNGLEAEQRKNHDKRPLFNLNLGEDLTMIKKEQDVMREDQAVMKEDQAVMRKQQDQTLADPSKSARKWNR